MTSIYKMDLKGTQHLKIIKKTIMNNSKFMLFLIIGLYSNQFLTSCCGSKLEAGANLISCGTEENPASFYNKVFICPGDDIHISWAGNDGKEVQIEEFDVNGKLLSNLGPFPKKGSVIVTPKDDVQYKINMTGGECNVEESITVNMIRDGEIVNIQAAPILNAEILKFTLKYTSGQVSNNLVATSISPICHPGCFAHNPLIPNYYYMCRPNKNPCNGDWTLNKTNITGFPITIGINSDKTIPLNFVPLEGDWEFIPQQNVGTSNGIAPFEITLTCR